MQWFKHYSNASESIKLQKIIDRFGMEGYGRYWLFLELLCSKFDGKNTVIELHKKEVLKKLEIRLSSSLKTFSDFLNSVEIFSIKFESDSVLSVDCGILLELQARDFKYEKTKRVVTDTKNKEERIKNKDKEAEKEDSSIPKDIFQIIKTNYQYSDDVIEEVRKDAWLKFVSIEDPKKDWRRFVANYFKFEKDKIRNKLIEMAKPKKNDNTAYVENLIRKVIENSHMQASEFQRLFEETELELIRSVGGSRRISSASPFDLKQIKNELALKDLGVI